MEKIERSAVTVPEALTQLNVQSLMQAVEQADSAEKLVLAVRQLAARQTMAAIPTLITVLRYNNPGAAVAAVDGLIALGEQVIPYLLDNIDGYNYGARAWATRVFAGIGDPRALDVLLEAAQQDFALSVRRAAAKGLGNLRWDKVAPEDLAPTQEQVLQALTQVLQDPEWVVRYAAIVALEQLALSQSELSPAIEALLAQHRPLETELIVQSRLALALRQLQPRG
jgi:phycocyanobilin lyase beta subunit